MGATYAHVSFPIYPLTYLPPEETKVLIFVLIIPLLSKVVPSYMHGSLKAHCFQFCIFLRCIKMVSLCTILWIAFLHQYASKIHPYICIQRSSFIFSAVSVLWIHHTLCFFPVDRWIFRLFPVLCYGDIASLNIFVHTFWNTSRRGSLGYIHGEALVIRYVTINFTT